MCGIIGIFKGKQHEVIEPSLAEMIHRGPDGNGVWADDLCTFGHTRLSIIDINGGAQPMADAGGKKRITFNGEIYNYRQLRAEMGEHLFLTHSDTEAILQLSNNGEPPEKWLQKLDGMFVFANWDGSDLFLARDPLGIKPLYTGLHNSSLVFASEIKALPKGTRNISEFPCGHYYAHGKGMRRFYRLPEPREEQVDVATAVAEIRRRLEEAVRKRLIADVPVGVFLSGGLDSSMIAALARIHKYPLETFSVGTEDSEDRPLAHEVSKYLDTRHFERVYTIEEAIEILPEVIYHLESFDCALVRSAIPNYFLAKLAREHVKVSLSGEGADELFAGYEYLKQIPMDKLNGELHHITANLHNTNLQRCDRMSMAHALEVRVPFLDVKCVDYAFRLPVGLKQYGEQRHEKWILRKVAETILPEKIAWRKKEKFAIGSGLADKMAQYAEKGITDSQFERERHVCDGLILRSKEELLYFRVFRQIYPQDELLHLVGRSRSV